MDALAQNLSHTCNEIKAYSVPKLFTGKCWYIGFTAFDLSSGTMKRKRIKLNSIEKVTQRRQYADGLIKRLISKLESGWNPCIEAENEKAYHTFAEACLHYKKYIDKLHMDGILREDTRRSYFSQLKNIEEWNKTKKTPIIYISI